MKSDPSPRIPFPRRPRTLIMPALVALTVLLLAITLHGVTARRNLLPHEIAFSIFSAAGVLAIALSRFLDASLAHRRRHLWGWLGALTTGIGLSALTILAPAEMLPLVNVVLDLAVIIIAILVGRAAAFLAIAITASTELAVLCSSSHTPLQWLQYIALPLLGVILVETIARLSRATSDRIHRLELIHEFSRQVTSSLETEQVLSLLNATIQKIIEADSYYVGLLQDDHIALDLFYDDGEYFNAVRIPTKSTLAGWVIEHQKPLLIPDLRRDEKPVGLTGYLIGKRRPSLSWVGVPITTARLKGIIALSSYTPEAFDHNDLELLENLAQHAALALDNALRYAEVEELSHLDSLTQVYNHGYFLEVLQKQTDEALLSNTPLSLIMLDIDHFKRYNDTYGHLAGDEILRRLCAIIRRHIKRTDAIGRWGGEEFVISLPTATGMQAFQVARRIQQSMAATAIHSREGKTIPAPTVSQGIAVFPDEADEIFPLIDLADRRLYIAKGRGRNQIEPREEHWRIARP